MLFLPDADLSGLAAKDTLNGVASKDRQALALVAAGTPARIVFGRDRLGAHIDNVLSHGAHVLIRALWCWAPGGLGIDAIEAVHFDDDIVPPGVERTDYLGTAGQGIDPWLAAAFAAQGITYADTLPGMAYTVFKVPRLLASSIGVPSIAAIIRGSKLPDPRTGTSAYTANPALALAAFLSADWGMGRTVDASSVQAAANACDALVGGRPRRAFGLTLGSVQRVDSWVDTLRTYAGCWVVPGHAGLRLVPDRPASVVATIDHAAGQILRLGALTKRSPTQAPTLVRVQYTDTALVPWRTEAYAEAALPGVSGGTTPRRESVVRLEGGVEVPEHATNAAPLGGRCVGDGVGLPAPQQGKRGAAVGAVVGIDGGALGGRERPEGGGKAQLGRGVEGAAAGAAVGGTVELDIVEQLFGGFGVEGQIGEGGHYLRSTV